MQQFADVTVNAAVFPELPTFENLIGLKFRILNTDFPDSVYEIISAAEEWDQRWGIQYNLRCKVIQGTEGSLSTPEDPARR